MSSEKDRRVQELIDKWKAHNPSICQNAGKLYCVRNPGFKDCPPLSVWPPHLLDKDDEVMAAVEHYFLTRCWVGSAKYPTWQVRAMRDLYDLGKKLGVTPQHNPDNPTTPPSAMQRRFQDKGIADGEEDLKKSGKSAPYVRFPPLYYY